MAVVSAKLQAASTRDLRHRVLTCLHKLSDRDTHSAAAADLESIAKTLSHDFIPSFLSSISATDASDKLPVRKQCLRLVSLLSEAHGNALSPYLSKLLSAVVRRLRDPHSAVRAACVDAIASISTHITKHPFTSIMKPLIDLLVTEQDQNSQIGVALCLTAAIDASPDPDPLYLRRLLPRLERLLKCESFRAKAALLALIGSVIGAGAASTSQTLKNLVPCLVEFIRCDDWAARKAAAEALVKLAMVEKEKLAEFKAMYLKTFEAKKFDKVKAVRETMTELVETWKEIPDVSDEISQSLEQENSSKEDASNGRYPAGSMASCTVTSEVLQMRKNSIRNDQSALPNGSVAINAQKRSGLDCGLKKPGPAMFRKLDCRKPSDGKIEIVTPHAHPKTVVYKNDIKDRDEPFLEKGEKVNRPTNPGMRRALINKSTDDRVLKLGGTGTGSRVFPYTDEDSKSTIVVRDITENNHRKEKESEDISKICKQLVDIEKRQSSLLDLLQNFIGSSQKGMHSLEARVQGLELALDEISYDLAVTTRRISNIDSEGTTCCKLPGAAFLNPKFWRRTGARHSTSCFSSSRGTPPTATICNIANSGANSETFNVENSRLRIQGSGGFIINPLAEIQRDLHGISGVSSDKISKNVQATI
ncbi:hypothetical protein NMG60_11004362 [Bertholletia excelsa]